MMNTLIHLPNTGFAIVREQVQVEHPFVIGFFCSSIGFANEYYYIGCIVGDPHNDPMFKKRLQRIRARLDIKNMDWHNSWNRMQEKQYKKRTAEQNYQSKLTKLINEYNRRKGAILRSSDLFAQTALDNLEREYQTALVECKKRYL